MRIATRLPHYFDGDCLLVLAQSRFGLEMTTPEAAASFYERQYHSDPDGYHRPGVCRHCAISLGARTEDMVMSLGVFGWAPNVCCAPCAKKGKEKYAAQEHANIESRFEGIIPPEFVTWDDVLGNNKAKQRVIDRFNIDSKAGMILFGTSGTCRTRLLWLIARQIVEWNLKNPGGRQRTFLVSDAYELATKGIPPEAERVDYWLIDDLGNEPQSSKFNTALLHAIRKRYDLQARANSTRADAFLVC